MSRPDDFKQETYSSFILHQPLIMRNVLLLLLVFVTVQASSQIIKMKIPSVTSTAGEEVTALQFFDSSTVSFSGGGSGVGRVKLSGIEIKKPTGPSATQLFKRSLDGTTMTDITFEFYDGANTLYYKMVLRDVKISLFAHLSPECSGCARLYNQIRFEPVKYEITDELTGVTIKYNYATSSFY